VQYRWAPDGRLLSYLNARGHSRTFAYTENADIAQVVDFDGGISQFRFDVLGRQVERVDPAGGRTRMAYDPLGQLIGYAAPDGLVERYAYDSGGNLTEYVDPSGRATRYRWGPCSRIAEIVRADGTVVRYEWSTEPGRLLRLIAPDGAEYSYEYDADDNVVKEVDFDGRETRFDYDLAGRRVGVINGAGELLRYERNLLGSIVKKTLADGSVAEYEYNKRNLMVAARNAVSVVEFVRDATGRIVEERQGDDWVRSRFDLFGLRVERTTSRGHSAVFEYGPSALLSHLRIDDAYDLRSQRDALGQETGRSLFGSAQLRQRFDSVGQLLEQWVGLASAPPFGVRNGPHSDGVAGEAVVRREMRYDRRGDVTRIDDARWGVDEYEYDVMDRLLARRGGSRGAEEFTYDLLGNRTAWRLTDTSRLPLRTPGPQQNGRANEPISAGAARFVYDAEGRNVARVESSADASELVWHYEWNSDLELTAVVRPDGERWTYEYDALGRRVRKRGPSVSHRFVWDGEEIVHEILNDSDVSTWVHDPHNSFPLAKVDPRGVYAVISDHLGTPRELIDTNGRIAWTARFLAWGAVAEMGQPATDCPIRFRGQWYDAESGLHYNRFRYYSPETGTFLSRDPLRLEAGFLAYRYAPNPLMWIDPWGLEAAYVVRNAKGEVVYVGITKQPIEDRQAQHREDPARANWVLEPVATNAKGEPLNLTHDQVKGIEQGLIDHYGLKKDDGKLVNKINSMSDENPKLDKRLKAGDPYVDEFLEGEGEARKRKKRSC
jgi:RHS repeat-associated protein